MRRRRLGEWCCVELCEEETLISSWRITSSWSEEGLRRSHRRNKDEPLPLNFCCQERFLQIGRSWLHRKGLRGSRHHRYLAQRKAGIREARGTQSHSTASTVARHALATLRAIKKLGTCEGLWIWEY